MRPIKFDLPLNGTRIATLEQLQENLTPEIFESFRSGKLTKWLRVRSLDEQAEAIEALLAADVEREVQLLKSLYVLFDGETNEDLLRTAIMERKKELPSSQEKIDTEIEVIQKTLKLEIEQLKNLRIDEFIASYSGTAKDTTAALMWSRYAVGQLWKNGTAIGETKSMTWSEAMKIAEIFNKEAVGGFTNWRLPTLQELERIIEKDKIPSINQAVFVKTPQIGFWSSSLYDSNNNYAYVINFRNGSSSYEHIDKSHAVRLVRDHFSFSDIASSVASSIANIFKF